jgi:hypothetical protein
MKNILLLLGILLAAQSLTAQDLDIYQKRKNSNYQLPHMNKQMSLEEFQLLNRTLRMQDMLYAMVVPGYVHFRAKDPAVGWTMVGLRSAGFGGLAYIYLKGNYTIKELFSTEGTDLPDYQEFKNQKNIAIASFGIIFATYFFDWIHGKYRLDKKQEYIRYKYGLKFNIETEAVNVQGKNVIYPNVKLQYNF